MATPQPTSFDSARLLRALEPGTQPLGAFSRALLDGISWLLTQLAEWLGRPQLLLGISTRFSGWRLELDARPASHLQVERVIDVLDDPALSGVHFRTAETGPAASGRLAEVASTDWSSDDAKVVLRRLERLDISELLTMTNLVSSLAERLVQASNYRSTHLPTLLTSLGHEEGRIHMITAMKPESQPRELMSKRRRQALRDQVSDVQELGRALTELSTQMATNEARLQQWWRIAEVAREANRCSHAQTPLSPPRAASPPALTALASYQLAVRGADASIRTLGSAVLSERLKEVWQNALDAKAAGHLSMGVAAQLTELIAEHFNRLVSRFLSLPGLEAQASFRKMFSSIGVHPLLGVSVLAGLVGLFAYAKALVELRELHIDASSIALISKGDFADFALRLGVPFLLLVGALVAVVGSWVAALQTDHRKPVPFFLSVAGRALLIGAVAAALYWWAPTRAADATNGFLVLATLVIIIPAVLLIAAGLTNGVDADDRCQLVLLWFLRNLASPLGLLVAFMLLGTILVSTKRISVLFSPGSTAGMEVATPFNREPAPARIDKVLESKSSDTPIRIDPRVARLSNVWLIRQVNTEQWTLINAGDVACLRDYRPKDIDAGSLLNQCTKGASASGVTAVTESVAQYANSQLGCNIEGFDSGATAAVLNFATAQPATRAQAQRWPSAIRWIPITHLKHSGLSGTTPASDRTGDIRSIADELSQHSSHLIWVLGFASTPGDPAANLDLSERRALALQVGLAHALKLNTGKDYGPRMMFRGLGESNLSGLLNIQDRPDDQLALAFVCHRA